MKNKKKSGLGKFLVGIGLGTGLGMLFAPKSGEELRKDLRNKLDEFMDEVKKIDLEEVKDNFINKLDDLKQEIEELDKEKVLEIAKDKSEAIKVKALELVEYAKEKWTPVIEKAADEVRKKAIDVTKDVLNKLEKNN